MKKKLNKKDYTKLNLYKYHHLLIMSSLLKKIGQFYGFIIPRFAIGGGLGGVYNGISIILKKNEENQDVTAKLRIVYREIAKGVFFCGGFACAFPSSLSVYQNWDLLK